MAANPSTNVTMAGRVTAADTNYIYGSSKDESSPGAGDGTPYFKLRADDIFGGQQALLKMASIVPSGNADTAILSQYLQALSELASGRAFNYDDSGIADEYILDVQTNQQGPQSYFDGMEAIFIAANSNTGPSTVIVNGIGIPVDIADTAVAGTIVSGARTKLRFNLGTGDFDIVSEGAVFAQELRTVSGTVAASALTVGLGATTLSFRDATISSGTVNARETAALSLIVPSTATLGTVNAVQSRLILLAIDNAGTPELAIVNLMGGVNLDETTLISTVAIDVTADLNNVIYSTTARANVPFRVVGFIESTQAIAGTWNTNPSTIQGEGGNALTAMGSLGYGQTWQDLTGSRASSITYYNTTGKPIYILITQAIGGSGNIIVNGVTIATGILSGSGNRNSMSFIIPPNASYSYTSTFNVWSELR